MSTTTLLAWWFWRVGRFRALWGLPAGSVILPALAITSLLCRARGATLLGLTGFFTLWSCPRFKSKWVMWGLLAIAPTYCFLRITNLWTGENLVNLLEAYVSKERSISVDARLRQEDVLIVRALKQPIFGWGGYNRARILEDEITDARVAVGVQDRIRYLENVDSLWSIVLGDQGFAGLMTMTIAMTLPVILFRGALSRGAVGPPRPGPRHRDGRDPVPLPAR